MDIQNRNAEGAPWFSYEISDLYLKDDIRHKFLLNFCPNYKATEDSRNNVPEEEKLFPGNLLLCVGQCRTTTNNQNK